MGRDGKDHHRGLWPYRYHYIFLEILELKSFLVKKEKVEQLVAFGGLWWLWSLVSSSSRARMAAGDEHEPTPWAVVLPAPLLCAQ